MFTIVANWKAALTFHQALVLSKDYAKDFRPIANLDVIVCPSFEALYAISSLLESTGLQLGAQNCSVYKAGAHTGQVLAESLREIGVTYSLIGHYETRKELKETNHDVAMQCDRLLDVGIKPIVCIGETTKQNDIQATFCMLDEQLTPVFDTIKSRQNRQEITIYIAYEPVWAIGTGMVPDEQHITEVFSWLKQRCMQELPGCSWEFLYGGSVTALNAAQLKALPNVQGFLVGGASLDFKNFQNIVSLL